MKTSIVSGYYGGSRTPCEVLTAENGDGSTWYCVEGSANINCTYDEVSDGVDIEELNDFDYFNWPDGVNDTDELIEAIES